MDQHTAIEVETGLNRRSWRRKSQFGEISASTEYENVVQYQELESEFDEGWVRKKLFITTYRLRIF